MCLHPACDSSCSPMRPDLGGGASGLPVHPTRGKRAAASPSERQWTTRHSSGALWLQIHSQRADETPLHNNSWCIIPARWKNHEVSTPRLPSSIIPNPSSEVATVVYDGPLESEHRPWGLPVTGPPSHLMSFRCPLWACLLPPLCWWVRLPSNPWWIPPTSVFPASADLCVLDFPDLPLDSFYALSLIPRTELFLIIYLGGHVIVWMTPTLLYEISASLIASVDFSCIIIFLIVEFYFILSFSLMHLLF